MRAVYISLTLTMALVIWSAANLMWGGEHHQGIIKADGKGYYAHLPAIFIHHDVEFGFYDSLENGKYYNPNYAYEYRKHLNGHTYNKYYCGTAIPMAPFFFGAHIYALNSDYPADGYSKPYNVSISIAAIFYLLASLWLIVLILKEFKIKNSVIAWVIPIIVFGTNWYYYVVVEPSVSHVYTVCLTSLLVLLGLRWGRTGRVNLIVIGLLIGLIILVRPVNGLVLALFPFFFPSGKAFLQDMGKAFSNYKQLIPAILLGLMVVGLQLVLYKFQTGEFLVYSYEEEGFNFADPQIFNVLFSYKKGLFVYTPITLIALFGLFPMAGKNFWQTLTLLLFFVLFTYIISSWWNWYYGGSFSSRVYLDIMWLFALLLGVLLDSINAKWLKTGLITVLIILVLFCQMQTYQYRRMLIHWDGLDKDRYWELFLNFDVFKK